MPEPIDEVNEVTQEQMEELIPRLRITPDTTFMGEAMTNITHVATRAQESMTNFAQAMAPINMTFQIDGGLSPEAHALMFGANSHNEERNEQPHESGAGAMPYSPAMYTLERQDLSLLPNGVYEVIPGSAEVNAVTRFMLTTVRTGALVGQRILKVECTPEFNRSGWIGVATLLSDGGVHVWSRCRDEWEDHWLIAEMRRYFAVAVMNSTVGPSRRHTSLSGNTAFLARRHCAICGELITIPGLDNTCTACTGRVRESREQSTQPQLDESGDPSSQAAALDALRSRLASPNTRLSFSDLDGSSRTRTAARSNPLGRRANRVATGQNNNRQDLIRSRQTSDVNMRSVK